MESIRTDFPALANRRNGKPPVYFDNACTTLVPQRVIDAMTEYYGNFPACGGGRSRHWFADEVNSRIRGNPRRELKGARRIVQDFIGAGSEKEIIFTNNASHSINIVALGFPFRPGDVVLLGDKEHNSNLIPWLRLQKAGSIRVEFIEPGPNDVFDLNRFQQRLAGGKVRLVSMAYTSNLTGYTIPAGQIIKIAHDHGARVLLDAAQTVPHQAVDVQRLDVDFMAFSAHKMCGPRGVGVLYGKKELLGREQSGGSGTGDAIEPVFLGGGTIRDATYDGYSLLGAPDCFELGVQNYAGQIATGAAIQYLQKVGIDRISAHESMLNRYLTEQLLDRYGKTGWFRIFGPEDPSDRGGILTFEVRRPNATGITEDLDARNNIMIRDGLFCVHSFLNKAFGPGWTRPRLPADHRMVYRLSLYCYNTIEECRIFLDTLDQIFKERSYL